MQGCISPTLMSLPLDWLAAGAARGDRLLRPLSELARPAACLLAAFLARGAADTATLAAGCASAAKSASAAGCTAAAAAAGQR